MNLSSHCSKLQNLIKYVHFHFLIKGKSNFCTLVYVFVIQRYQCLLKRPVFKLQTPNKDLEKNSYLRNWESQKILYIKFEDENSLFIAKVVLDLESCNIHSGNSKETLALLPNPVEICIYNRA